MSDALTPARAPRIEAAAGRDDHHEARSLNGR